MHKLLERQLKLHFGSPDAVPAQLRPFLESIEQAYASSDADREMLERSLELTSQELLQRNAELRREVVQLATTQEALRQSEAQYRLIVETATEGIWLVGRNDETTFVNRRMADMLGYAVEEMMNRPLLDFMDEAGREVARQKLRDRRSGAGEQHDFKFLRKDGTPVMAIVSANPMLDDEGRYGGTLGMITDITERWQYEEKIKAANQRLEELVQFRTQFLNNTAHELATPLTPILIQSQLLRQSLAPIVNEKQRQGLEILSRNLNRFAQLVGDVLDAARLQAGRLQLTLQPTDLAALVQEAADSNRGFAGKSEIRLETDVRGPLMVSADTRRISQVVFNLLSNAIKFTPQGGRVRVEAMANGDEALVNVVDTGIGIGPEKMGRLFQPFVQVHDQSQSAIGGTGLGLFVCRGILEEHGGGIWCDSSGPNQGATFTFRLPLLQLDASDGPGARAAEPDLPLARASPWASSSSPLGSQRVGQTRT